MKCEKCGVCKDNVVCRECIIVERDVRWVKAVGMSLEMAETGDWTAKEAAIVAERDARWSAAVGMTLEEAEKAKAQ
jgi:hypothetical protein